MHGHISITPADITAGVALVTAGFMFKDYTPKTTYNYFHAGGKNIDEAAIVLNKKREGRDEFIIPDTERLDQQDRYNLLIEERTRLEQDNQTYTGSFRNWNSARQFYRDTTLIYDETRTLSARHGNLVEKAATQARVDQSSQVGRFQGYTHNNSGSVNLSAPSNGCISPSGYGPQSPVQTVKTSPHTVNGYPSQNSSPGVNRDYTLPNHPYATYRG